LIERKKNIWPSKLLISPESADDSLTKRIISRLPQAEVIHLDSSGDAISEQAIDTISAGPGESDADTFTRGKRMLQLTRHKGSWLKACPGTSSHVCCNLFIVNPGEGCPFDCTYCYLQSYLQRNPTLKLYTNTKDMLAELRLKIESNPERLFRVGTGELIDSLVWDEISDQSMELVPFFASFPNAVLELKTKDNFVDNLIALKNEHLGQTVVSWSVNAKSITEKEELNTARLDERLEAAAKVAEAGYRVGFHFDPIIYFEGWEDEYRDTISQVFKAVSPKDIAWVSLSTLRYKPELQAMMMQRFPESSLPFGEQFLAKDKKIRYLQPLRLKMQRFLWEELKSHDKSIPTYMCMESSTAWRNISGSSPAAGSELREVFSKRGRLPIIGQEASS
jgi:spore photoproduct lyase